MRFYYVVLATAVAYLASTDLVVASTNVEQSKLVIGVETPLQTPSLAAAQNAVAEKRLLRADGDTGDNLSAEEEERESTFMEKTQFYYWYLMGRTPEVVYKNFFEGMDRSIVVKNPNYKVWQRYEEFYNNKKNKS
ncbi:hypothetical protein F442_15040 [Phytophthora nicotianae P10297]|uniref:RxLR effector protein n=4 Tax=Phytophthora nicotianae TaxID=4792 RepID=W2YSK2_PHYNI|nr:hypothetical protein PPTG_15926 [Phytophthora nicotianae INRA-310]ETO67951.1 hypothetical protein F444_15185 [Phytophthora nicotianae P1976]ETP37125.1 hypothetical protein F442_15042 [Phytophthora nicotianae P10297]KUF87688.1 hypothetical protein AM587_10005863 [Phytophthora nicotianae]ETN03712.1 hypothetical protein PPTG_15926 [Phytophthora nicotianae INRA-310]ETP37144.1 hypothetical protein F442_15040 [Phytophthora nicotianae P10297]